jgi:hypothetical protein
MRNGIIIALSLIFLNLKSQFSIDSLSFNPSLEDSIILDAITPPGEVIEHIDSFYHRTEALQKKINLTRCPDLVNGFRVHLFSCSGEGCKEKALKYYNQFLIAYPNIPVYKVWQPPTLKVKAGDCRTRFQAEEIKNKVKDDFPFVFIAPDHITSAYKIDCEDMIINKSDSLLIVLLREK